MKYNTITKLSNFLYTVLATVFNSVKYKFNQIPFWCLMFYLIIFLYFQSLYFSWNIIQSLNCQVQNYKNQVHILNLKNNSTELN